MANGRYNLSDNNDFKIRNYLKSELLEHCKSIKINFLDNTNLFTENEWKELYKLSEDTFVEESNTSKSEGAGAGFTDND